MHRWFATVVAIMVLCAAAWIGRAPLLQGAAELWIVSDPVEPADAVAIFGGGLEVRPFAAAAYYRAGLAKKIVVANLRAGRAETVGAVASHTAANRSVLLKLGVPEEAIEIFGRDLMNTREETIALRDWAIRAKARSIIVPTEIFSARRVHYSLAIALAGTDIKVYVPALDADNYTRANWWQNDLGIIQFQNEVLKYVYYRLKY